MYYHEFLEEVICRAEADIDSGYSFLNDDNKKDGAKNGLEACRGKEAEELREVLITCTQYVANAHEHNDRTRFWWFRSYQTEVQHVIDVMSAFLKNDYKEPILPGLPTHQGYTRAVSIMNKKNTT